MNEPTLRGLSRDYAAGDLDRDTYRLRRRELLVGIVSGNEPLLKFRPPEPETPTVFPYDDDDGDTTQEILPVLGPPSSSARMWLIASVAVIAALAAGAAWFGLRDSGEESAPDAPAQQPAPGVPAQPNLLEEFLDSKVWSSDSIASLEKAWSSLDRDARAKVRSSDTMADFSTALLRQYATEAALLELGDTDQAFAAQSRLLDLGERLELDDERLQRARDDWLALAEQRDPQDQVAEAPIATSPAPEPDPASAAADLTEGSGDDPEVPTADKTIAPETSTTTASPAAPKVLAPTAPVPTTTSAPATSASKREAAPRTTSTGTATKTNCKAALARTRRPYCIDVLAAGEKGPALVVLKPGTFEMGGSEAQELPRRTVTIDYPLALGLFEVSAAELQRFCTATATPCPTQPWNDDELPAVNVSWKLAHDYAVWLSKITGFAYRLPSEAEWEYAARAGTTSVYPFGDELLPTHAHYSFTNAQDRPLKANDRSINRNEFRLYHMLGNVREWVQDNWQDSYAGAPTDGSARTDTGDPRRVVRGGSYADHSAALRSGARQALATEAADIHTGFRVVRAIAN